MEENTLETRFLCKPHLSYHFIFYTVANLFHSLCAQFVLLWVPVGCSEFKTDRALPSSRTRASIILAATIGSTYWNGYEILLEEKLIMMFVIKSDLCSTGYFFSNITFLNTSCFWSLIGFHGNVYGFFVLCCYTKHLYGTSEIFLTGKGSRIFTTPFIDSAHKRFHYEGFPWRLLSAWNMTCRHTASTGLQSCVCVLQ